MLSHLWEIVESGIDYGGEWANFRMLLAACWGNVNDIEEIINSGGNVNYKTWLGYTPLMYASFFNTAEAVKFLIKKGADINDGLVSRAVEAGNVDAVKVLLSLGAKLPGQNAPNDHDSHARNEKTCPKC